jgi:hypothetical protein
VAEHDHALDITQNPRRWILTREECEERVECANRSGEQCSGTTRKLPFDPVDVESVRDDQPRVAIECLDKPVEQECDFAGMGRTDDE